MTCPNAIGALHAPHWIPQPGGSSCLGRRHRGLPGHKGMMISDHFRSPGAWAQGARPSRPFLASSPSSCQLVGTRYPRFAKEKREAKAETELELKSTPLPRQGCGLYAMAPSEGTGCAGQWVRGSQSPAPGVSARGQWEPGSSRTFCQARAAAPSSQASSPGADLQLRGTDGNWSVTGELLMGNWPAAG